ncbi:unnamed protein product [Dracunculus medinensis]|uniref:DUF7627 domain-containing protein n=1 Tax=Dracunculus medinensis TaxID=318479 RepID=A0A3P7PQB2_DRAME|nr:unnamed protein product [Dracunculus medinensis]
MNRFTKDEWNRFSKLLFDSTFNRNKDFQSSFGEKLNSALSSYILCSQIVSESLPTYIGSLLVAAWPRAHSRSNKESNELLYEIISAIKGWLEVITDEVFVSSKFKFLFVEDDSEMVSKCATGLAEICQATQRRLWMQWPELTDEIFMAIRDCLTCNSCMAKRRLFDVVIQMTSWTHRNSKSKCSISTQTHTSSMLLTNR